MKDKNGNFPKEIYVRWEMVAGGINYVAARTIKSAARFPYGDVAVYKLKEIKDTSYKFVVKDKK